MTTNDKYNKGLRTLADAIELLLDSGVSHEDIKENVDIMLMLTQFNFKEELNE